MNTKQVKNLIPTVMLLLAMMLTPVQVAAERIKDLASIAGVRVNQLVVYGVVGQLGVILHIHLLQDT